MICSFEHRFVFLKVPKTGGTSVEVLLSQVAGRDAIVTPVIPPEPGHEPRNFRRTGFPARDAFEALVRRPTSRHIVMGSHGVRSVWPIFGGRSGIEVDFVGRFERLEHDLGIALGRIGLECGVVLPRAKSGLRASTGQRRHGRSGRVSGSVRSSRVRSRSSATKSQSGYAPRSTADRDHGRVVL